MKRYILLLPLVVLMSASLAFGQLQAPGTDNTPTVGEMAPGFELLKEFEGESNVLIAFFPAAFTGG
jgi:hypothetical protein